MGAKAVKFCEPARSIAVAFVVTVLGVVATSSGSARTVGTETMTPTGKVPLQLVGSWTRNVTAADWKKAGAPAYVGFAGLYTMVVRRSGDVEVDGPGTADFAPRFSFLAGGRLSADHFPECPFAKGLYRWKVAGRLLTLTKLRDRCTPQVGLYAGTWKRR